jgi:hypothetical protein
MAFSPHPDARKLDLPGLDPDLLAGFRARLTASRERNPEAWESSRRLIGQSHVPSTLNRLAAAIQSSSMQVPLRDALLGGLRGGAADRIQDLPADTLKHLTGLPATKAVRALCVLFGVTDESDSSVSVSTLTAKQIERFVRVHRNPFDLLLETEVASLLDLGAGDLTFAAELVEQYGPLLRRQNKDLTLHGVDRLNPGSKLGSLLHADRNRLESLRDDPPPGVRFQFWGNQDMFELGKLKPVWPRYTIVTCHAPPTPAVAYEPTRLSHAVIDEHLRTTKGRFRKVRVDGEAALEVMHQGRALLFPPWKFEIRGPLALLDLISGKGKLCILSAVDTEVFWELLSQLLADARFRPQDVLFTPSVLAQVFGETYAKLSALPIGGSVALADLEELRQDIPRVLAESGAHRPTYRFRYVEIRRGAVFEGLPASHTARLFEDMKEEAPPWMVILVPEDDLP